MSRKYSDSIKRSLVKSVTWRLVVVVSDIVVIYALTHRVDLAIDVMIATNLASMVFYYFHERIWNTIHWGRTK